MRTGLNFFKVFANSVLARQFNKIHDLFHRDRMLKIYAKYIGEIQLKIIVNFEFYLRVNGNRFLLEIILTHFHCSFPRK